MPQDRRKVEKALKKKGFNLEDARDHRFYFLNYPKLNKRIFTKVSTGTKYKTLNDSLINKMALQLKLSKKEFLQYIECSIDKEEYNTILTDKNIID